MLSCTDRAISWRRGLGVLHGRPRARIAVYWDALGAIAGSDARVVLRALDRKRLRARYVNPFPDHEVVLAHLLERIDELAEDEYDGEPVLVIADEIDNSVESASAS